MKHIANGLRINMRIVCITAALSLVMLLTACKPTGADTTNEHPYDYYIDCTTREQLAELANEPFVESIFAFSLMQFALPDNGGGERRLMLLATDSFENIDASSFERQTLVDGDAQILQAADKNPIIIDEALSKAEGLRVGDTLTLPNRLTDGPAVFTVAAIYSHTSLFAQYDAVILCNEKTNPAFYAAGEDMGYSAAYVKASDPQGLEDYLQNEFFPGLIARAGEMTQQEIDSTPREEIAVYYENYAEHSRRSE